MYTRICISIHIHAQTRRRFRRENKHRLLHISANELLRAHVSEELAGAKRLEVLLPDVCQRL